MLKAEYEIPSEIIQNPHNLKTYMGNEQIKAHRADVNVEWQSWEEQEYLKCAMDVEYFAAKYVKIVHVDRGLVSFELYPYQKKMYETIEKNRFSIVLSPRQSGKSIAFVIWLLHYAIFNRGKTIVIGAQNLDTAMEMLSRIQLALENLPFFLQPGCQTLNKKTVVFSNKSKIYARATGKNTLRGLSVNILFLDEFALVDNSEKFYTGAYPTISSGKDTKLIITSTANGIGNAFFSLWDKAKKKENDFASFEVKWNEVPGRDDKWREETIARTSARQFMQEFENRFLGGTNTLIDGDTLLMLQGKNPIFFRDNARVFEEPKRNHSYVITADVSEGVGGDFSTFSVIDVTAKPFNQVAVFQDNKTTPYMFAETLVRYAKIYNNAYLCIESNDHGSVVNYSVTNDLEYDNVYSESFQDINKIGVKTTRKSKRLGCTNLKDLVEGFKLTVNDNETIQELGKFEEHSGTFKAAKGCHDDLAMNLVIFGYLASTNHFKNEFNTDLKTVLYSPEVIERLQSEQVPPFGIIDDHQDASPGIVVGRMSPSERYENQTTFKKDDIFGVIIEERSPLVDNQNFSF